MLRNVVNTSTRRLVLPQKNLQKLQEHRQKKQENFFSTVTVTRWT